MAPVLNLVELLHSSPTCEFSRLVRGVIRLETKLECGAITHDEYLEEFRDLWLKKSTVMLTPDQEVTMNLSLQNIQQLAIAQFTDMELR